MWFHRGKLLNWNWTKIVHNEAKNSQCEQWDFAESNTGHLKCNTFTGWRVLCVKFQMSDKINELLKKHVEFHSFI